MIEQNVQVVSCQDERLWVRMGSQSGCSACDNGKGCGAGVFAKLLRRKPVVLELARNELSVKAGQMLTLAIPEQVYMRLVFDAYGWPLLAALAGALAGNGVFTWLQFGPLMIDAGTLCGGLLTAWFVVHLIKSRKPAGAILSSLNTVLYYSSTTPNMCSKLKLESDSFKNTV